MSMCNHHWVQRDGYRECLRCGHSEWMADRVRHQVDEAMDGLCYHCGKPPEADGDHTCPCPYSDATCPNHAATRPSQGASGDAGSGT